MRNYRAHIGTDVAATGSDDGTGAGVVQEARSAIAGRAEARVGGAPVAPGRQEGPGGPTNRRRGERDTDTTGTAEWEVHAGAREPAVTTDGADGNWAKVRLLRKSVKNDIRGGRKPNGVWHDTAMNDGPQGGG